MAEENKEKKAKKKSTFFTDFKTFISRGNIINLAIAVTIGAAFGAIVTSLVNDIITPFIALLFGKDSFTDLRWVLKEAVVDADGIVTATEIAVRYGAFIQTILNFLVIAFFIFLVFRIITKATNSIKKAVASKETAPATPPAPPKPTQEELLTEIRDLLKEANKPKTD